MQINFVSLFDAVRAIAPRIEVSQGEVDLYADLPGEDDSFGRLLAQASLRQFFQKSRAAFRLLNCLFNTPAAIRWFDIALTGFPLQSEDARKEGRDELVRWTKQEQEFQANVDRMRRLSPRWRDATPDTTNEKSLSLNPPKSPRSCSIGFDRIELIRILDQNTIPHNLGELPPFINEHIDDSIAVPLVAADTPTAAEPSASTQKKRRQFRGPLAEVLKMAQEAAKDPDDPQSVWIALVNIARRKDRPLPILGYVDNENVVQWEDEGAKADEEKVRYFGRSDMTRRFRQS
ncbi:hypothetical protein [Noviherbaspirillum massiliense]|uniref:hypothetical protein n=1 Tax=Noviherbaspirillum massiliense TaxID=1465823 RepID=UPI0003734FA0|nr:hypothetical protein [Noviherbaspirillum massiliense]